MAGSRRNWIILLIIIAGVIGAWWWYESSYTTPLQILSIFNPRNVAAPETVTVSEPAELTGVSVSVPTRLAEGSVSEYHTLNIPEGFSVSVFASGFAKARFMATEPTTGRLFLSDSRAGTVYLLDDTDKDGVADENKVFFSGMTYPHGLAFHDGWLYVATENQVVRIKDTDGDDDGDQREVIVPDIPSGGSHISRTIVFGPDGKMYVSIGSTCNACDEKDRRRGAVVRYDAEGSGEEIFADGLRNSVGLAIHPETDELWGSDNGRDFLGDDLPPEEINIIKQGKNYGWPKCYGQRIVDPDFGTEELCQTTEPPLVEMQAHSAPLGIRFIRDTRLPDYLQGSLLVAFHGSWNRREPTGYKIVRIAQSEGRYRVSDFITGWLAQGKVWGRPVDMIVGTDGALYVSDDELNVVYKMSYQREAS